MGCVTDEGYKKAANDQKSAMIKQATLDVAIQVAIALWQRKASERINGMQQEIADRQIKLAEAVQAHAEQFWPAELALVTEVYGESKATPQYLGTSIAWQSLASESLAAGRQEWRQEARRMCIPPSRCADARFQRASVTVQVDFAALALRVEEARTQELNDRRYERRYKVLHMGQGRLSQVAGFQDASRAAGGAAAAALSGTINSAMNAFGYFSSRNAPGEGGYGSVIRDQWQESKPGEGRMSVPQNAVVQQSVAARGSYGVLAAPTDYVNRSAGGW